MNCCLAEKLVAHAHAASHRPSGIKIAKKRPLRRYWEEGGKRANESGGTAQFEKWVEHAEDATQSSGSAEKLPRGRLGRGSEMGAMN